MKPYFALLLACSALQAHEIGTTRVTANFIGGRYDLEIATDASALAEKLQTEPAQIATKESIFRKRITLAFDTTEVRPDITFRVEPAESITAVAGAIIHLTGDLPHSAKTFTWKFGWT